MKKCPFWSNGRDKVNCDSGCPMSPKNNNDEECVFLEHLAVDTIVFKEIVEKDFSYNEEEKIDFNIGNYSEY